MKKYIVKVQLSKLSNKVLVYTQDKKTILYEGFVDESIMEALDGQEKGYFLAHIVKDKRLSLDKEIGWQPW